MKSKNICKFIPPSVNTGLSVSCFILESDAEVMSQQRILSEHCAVLVIKGEGYFLLNGSPVPFTAGNLVFGFKNESFFAEPKEKCEYMYISFSGYRADELLKRFDITVKNRLFSGFDGIIPLWKESLSRANEATIDLASESMLLYAFSRLSGDLSEKNGIISRITEISENGFTDPELSITVIATELGYNSKYISHLFKEKTGITYSEYLRTLRIKYAVSLFDHGIDSVKNVALLSGFGDPLYFSTVFKNATGVSPKKYLSRTDGNRS